MEKRVAIFSRQDEIYLESEINEFLQDIKGKLHEIKLVVNGELYTALLIYTPDSNE